MTAGSKQTLSWSRRLSNLIGGAFLFCAVPFGAVAAPVDVTVEPHRGYYRVLLKTQEITNFEARIENSVLLVRFDRESEFDMRELSALTAPFVAMARQDKDGKGLRLALSRSVKLSTSAVGKTIALDIMAPSFSGETAEVIPILSEEERLAEELAETELLVDQGPIEIRPLRVRVGRFEDYSRIIFDWPDRIEYNAELKDGTAELVFEKAADPDLVELRTDPPAYVTTAEKEIEGDTLTVSVRVSEEAGMRHFREANSVVVDVLGPDALPTVVDDAVAALDEDPEDIEVAEAVSAATQLEPAETILPDGDLVVEAEEEVSSDEEPEVALTEPEPLPDPETFPLGTDGNPGVEEQEELERAEAPEELEEQHIAQSALRSNVLKVAAVPLNDSLKLIFNWGGEKPASIFKRHDTLWVVFDEAEAALDFSAIGRRYNAFVEDVLTERQGDALIARIKLVSDHLATATYEEGAWVVTLGPSIEKPTLPLDVKRASDSRGQSMVMVPLVDAGSVHWLRDFEIGDDLAVVTANAPSRGIISSLEFVDFKALSSAHGLSFQVKADNVYVRIDREVVQVGKEEGLNLSVATDYGELLNNTPLGERNEPGFMDFEEWKIGPIADFPEIEQQLHLKLTGLMSEETTTEANEVRLGLARFYLSHGMSPEALGVLDLYARNDETAELNPAFRALRGAARHLQGNNEWALDDLSQNSLATDPHVTLWRGAVLNELSRHEEANRQFKEGLTEVSRYAPEWQAYFRIAAAKSALEGQDLERVDRYLQELPDEDVPTELLAEAELVRGQSLEKMDRVGEALQHYQRVSQVGSERLIAQSTLAKTILLHRLGQISDQDAIERLDILRFQWRGDDLELTILHKLGELYVENGDYRHGLTMMQEVVSNYSQSAVAGNIATSMIEIFKRIFLEESIEDVPPVQALALYYEFKALTPIGREGDEMIRKLVDRLVAFDLLEQAAELMEHQVHERLQGVARAQVAMRLAMIYLTDGKSEKALRTIRNTRQTRLPKDIAYARRLLEARSLVELSRFDHALEVVEAYDTEEVVNLRADIYWKAQDWPNAGKKLESLLGDRWRDKAPLAESERNHVMRTALAYSFSEDKVALERIRRKYGPQMSNSPDADGFQIVTEDTDIRGVEFTKLASKIATTDTLDSFMKNFQAKFPVDEPVIN